MVEVQKMLMISPCQLRMMALVSVRLVLCMHVYIRGLFMRVMITVLKI